MDRTEMEAKNQFYPTIYDMKIIITYFFYCLCSEKQSDVRHHHLPKMKPLPSINSLGPPPQKPSRPTVVNLQAFQRQRAAVPKTQGEGKEMHRTLHMANQESPPSLHLLPGDHAAAVYHEAGHPSLLILI